MAAPRVKYSMQWKIRYNGNLVNILDRLRAIRTVLLVKIDKDLGKGKELVTVKVMTPHPPHETFKALRRISLGKIENLHEVTMFETTLTKMY